MVKVSDRKAREYLNDLNWLNGINRESYMNALVLKNISEYNKEHLDNTFNQIDEICEEIQGMEASYTSLALIMKTRSKLNMMVNNVPFEKTLLKVLSRRRDE